MTATTNTAPPILFIDFETTGLSADLHAPIAIAAVVLGGKNHDARFHQRMAPHPGAEINPFAMNVNGYREEEIRDWMDPGVACTNFIHWIDDVFPPPTLVMPGGYNYAFDERFLRAWISRNYSPAHYGQTFSPDCIEVMQVIKGQFPDWRAAFGNMKLVTQYQTHFGRSLADAHTEMADALATRDLFLHCDSKKASPRYADYHGMVQYTVATPSTTTSL